MLLYPTSYKRKLFALFIILVFILQKTNGQVVADFSIPDTVCIGENLALNSLDESNSYTQWDLCIGDFEEAFELSTIDVSGYPGGTRGFHILQEGGNKYFFVLNGSTISELYFAQSDSYNLSGNEVFSSVSALEGELRRSEGMSFVQDAEGSWVAYIGHLDVNFGIVRVKFGDGLSEEPTAIENIGVPLGGNRTRGLKAINDNGKYYLVSTLYNNNRISVIDLGSDPFSAISTGDKYISSAFSQLNFPTGIEIIKYNGEWIGFVASQSNDKIVRFNFGASLLNPPVFESAYSLGLSQPRELKLIKDGDTFYLLVGAQGAPVSVVDLGDLDKDYAVNRLDYQTDLPASFSFALVDSASVKSVIIAEAEEMNYYLFDRNCGSNIKYSEEKNIEVFYNESGTFPVNLSLTDESGNHDNVTKFITVANSQAPIIDIVNQSICFGSANELVLSSDQTLISANWTINGDIRNGDTISYIFPSSGDYPITLEVEATNGCGQRITKPITIYDPPEPDFLVEASGALCSNGAVSFTNQTNTQGADSLITYNWNFSGEDSTTATSPEFIFTAGGDKTVTLTAAIPGCEASKDTTFTVFEGPAVYFAYENQCEGEPVQFLNQTTGSNITQYQWDFGDGNTFSSTTMASPEHMFEGAGDYAVSLTVNDAQGCENEVVQTFSSFAKPEAVFTAELSCAGTPTLFTDETQIDASANVVLWQWDFGDNSPEATIKNPEHTFGSPGTYTVQLVAETNEGCVDAVTQQITVETPVQPGFEAIKICPSEALDVQLNDTSLVTGGEAVTQWLWQIEAESRPDDIYQTQNPMHTFDAPGEYTVSLTATASSLCNASVTRTVTVVPLPEADFSFTQACANDAVAFTDLSAHPEYIANYLWDFGGAGTSTVPNPAFAFDEAGTYAVELTIEDIHGCTDTLTQSIEILPQPTAGFTVENTTGAAPFVVSFENTSTDASQYQWDFAGLDTSTAISPTFTFEEPGNYPVQLSVANTIGCADTFLRTFTIVQPVFDVSLDNITLQAAANGGTGTNIILTVSNPGTLPVQGFHVAVEIDKQLALERNFGSTIEPGATLNFPLGVAFSNINHAEQYTRYVCATLTPLEDNFVETEKGDNIFCLNVDESFYSLPPFPNPAQGLLEVSLILPTAERVDVTLATVTGDIMQNYTFSDVQAGLNTLQLDVSPLPAGVYILTLRYQGRLNTYRLVINP